MQLTLWRYVIVSTSLALLVICRALCQYPSYYASSIAVTHSALSGLVIGNLAVAFSMVIVHALCTFFFGTVQSQEMHFALRATGLVGFDAACLLQNLGSVTVALSHLPYMLNISSCSFIQSILEKRVALTYDIDDQNQLSKRWRLWLLVVGVLWYDVTVAIQQYRQTDIVLSLTQTAFVPSLYYFVQALDLLRSALICVVTMVVGYYEAYIYNKGIDLDHEEADEWVPKELIIFITAITTSAILLCFDFFLQSTAGSRIYAGSARCYNMFAITRDFLSSRKARAALHAYVTEAVPADLERDNTCVICRDEMVIGAQRDRAKPAKLVCGHVIHFGCLKSWITRSQNCPMCRQALSTAKPAFTHAEQPNFAFPVFLDGPQQAVPQGENQAVEQGPRAEALQELQPLQQPQEPHILQAPQEAPQPPSVHQAGVGNFPSEGGHRLGSVGDYLREREAIRAAAQTEPGVEFAPASSMPIGAMRPATMLAATTPVAEAVMDVMVDPTAQAIIAEQRDVQTARSENSQFMPPLQPPPSFDHLEVPLISGEDSPSSPASGQAATNTGRALPELDNVPASNTAQEGHVETPVAAEQLAATTAQAVEPDAPLMPDPTPTDSAEETPMTRLLQVPLRDIVPVNGRFTLEDMSMRAGSSLIEVPVQVTLLESDNAFPARVKSAQGTLKWGDQEFKFAIC